MECAKYVALARIALFETFCLCLLYSVCNAAGEQIPSPPLQRLKAGALSRGCLLRLVGGDDGENDEYLREYGNALTLLCMFVLRLRLRACSPPVGAHLYPEPAAPLLVREAELLVLTRDAHAQYVVCPTRALLLPMFAVLHRTDTARIQACHTIDHLESDGLCAALCFTITLPCVRG